MARIAAIKSTVNKQLQLIAPNDQGAIGEDLTRLKDDPAGFIRYLEPDIILTDQQIRILEHVRDQKSSNFQASHGLGKSFIVSWTICWWVFAVHGFCIATSPTHRQIDKIVFSGVRRIYDRHKAKFGGRRTEMRIFLREGVEAYGFSTSDHNDSAAQGIHAEYLLVVEDEACGISVNVDNSLMSCVTGVNNRILRIGNPTKTGTPFEAACNLSHVRMPCWEHINVKWAYELHSDGIHRLKPDIAARILKPKDDPSSRDEPVKDQSEWDEDLPRDVIKGAISIAWIEGMRLKKGEKSPFWYTRIEGMFSDTGGTVIVPKSYFVAARARYDINPYYWEDMNRRSPWSFGADIGAISDPHAISGFHGNLLAHCREIPCLGDRTDVVRIAKIIEEEYLMVYPDCRFGIDSTGVGAGTLAYLIDRGWGSQVWAANFGESATKENEHEFSNLYLNWKAEWFWKLREFLAAADGNDDHSAIAPLDAEEILMNELANIYYEETANAKLRVEEKRKTISRLGKSPNCADSAIIALAGRESVSDILWRSAYS